MPVAHRCRSVRQEHSYEIWAEGEKRSMAAAVVVHCGELVMDWTVQKRYGVGVVIEEQLVKEMSGLSGPVRRGEVAEDSTAQKKYAVVAVVIEGQWVEEISGPCEPCPEGPSLREGRHR